MIEMSILKYQYQWDERRHYTETVTDATSTPVRIPADKIDILVTAIPDGVGSVNIQFTNDDYDTVDAGTADWIDWSNGNSTAATYAAIPRGSTAVRCVSSGVSKFVVTA